MLTYEEFLIKLKLVKSEMSRLLYDMYKECHTEQKA